ncbi:uncharacterized protein LY89DRAFT_303703 [Mollisia scopiformis]|uniref:Uncharacterized protein n=1 Tax=Mollisia scopiformis TaxID=149040 RepID=A0A194XS53_MOLSC|nr:uncharacterized protein LY89DRAFT_303703 [Mollisia scopiformis]KUJ22557.1 hypothetical protein LY89DRAFT_303703 [Mollisia scopiformis]
MVTTTTTSTSPLPTFIKSQKPKPKNKVKMERISTSNPPICCSKPVMRKHALTYTAKPTTTTTFNTNSPPPTTTAPSNQQFPTTTSSRKSSSGSPNATPDDWLDFSSYLEREREEEGKRWVEELLGGMPNVA